MSKNMRNNAHHRHESHSDRDDSDNNPQCMAIAMGIFLVILAAGFFFGAYIYLTTGGTSCHLGFGVSTRISSQIINGLLNGVCGIFDSTVSDRNKPIVGGIFLTVMGGIMLALAWRKFASVGGK